MVTELAIAWLMHCAKARELEAMRPYTMAWSRRPSRPALQSEPKSTLPSIGADATPVCSAPGLAPQAGATKQVRQARETVRSGG
jgi:hypothetical protein